MGASAAVEAAAPPLAGAGAAAIPPPPTWRSSAVVEATVTPPGGAAADAAAEHALRLGLQREKITGKIIAITGSIGHTNQPIHTRSCRCRLECVFQAQHGVSREMSDHTRIVMVLVMLHVPPSWTLDERELLIVVFLTAIYYQ